MKSFLFLVCLAASPLQAQAPVALQAEVVGFATLPADTFQMPPADAPYYFKTSGRYANAPEKKLKPGQKDNAISYLSTPANPRPTGWSLPLPGQPIQGFSGIVATDKNNFWVLVDNGFGFKNNSHDALLKIHRLKANWSRQRLEVTQTLFLNDKNNVAPFPIALETTETRYLTGVDFDPESLQVTPQGFFVGDEFGPFLLHFGLDGSLRAVHDLRIQDQHYFSVDHPLRSGPGKPDATGQAAVARSRGFEGMALSADGKTLYPMLEGPLYDARKKSWDQHQGKHALTIFEFDLAQQKFTTRRWKYVLENNNHNLGDFNFIDDRHAWVIERDNREGDPYQQCGKSVQPSCFDRPAAFKRLYLIELNPADTATPLVRKLAYVDLMNLKDRGNKTGRSHRGVFNMPFFTIENVDAVAPDQVVVGNDNNLPFSSGRTPLKNDDNELVWLKIKGVKKVLR